MSEKRRDKKGRVLRTGENQRKDGMYEYKYTDAKGVRRSVYSWKLVDTDSVPAGKRCKDSLRNLEKLIQRDVDDGIDTYSGSKITLNQCFEMSLQKRVKLRGTTRITYKVEYDRHFRDTIGDKMLNSIAQHHLISLYTSLLSSGLKPATIECLNICIKPSFALAKKNGWIRTDPTEGVITEMKNLFPWEKTKKKGLTEEEQEIFMRVVKETPRFQWLHPLVTFLLGTGCRIGEALALRWQDCNFTKGWISINRTLVYRTERDDPATFHLNPPKSSAGKRVIPMFTEVRQSLQTLQEMQRELSTKITVDGFQDFVFLTPKGSLYYPASIHAIMKQIVKFYNEAEKVESQKEKREPVFLPPITPHVLRHTFCTRLCENETNLKVIQEIMGHKNISMTMDVYNDATEKKKKKCFENLDGKMKIG